LWICVNFCVKPQSNELISESLEVLLDPVLDPLGAMAKRAQVRVYPSHHILGAMTQLPAHRVETDRGAVVERLESSRRVGVPEDPAPDLTSLPARPHGDPVNELPHVNQPGFLARTERWKQQPSAPLEAVTEHVGAENVRELGEQGDHAPRGSGLEPAPLVGPERDGLPVEAHVVQLETEDLPRPAACEQERGD